MSDIVKYFDRNPDPALSGCLNSGKVEDGCVFSGIEPLVGAYCYVGRTSLLEAVGLLYGVGAKEVHEAMSDGQPRAQKLIEQLKRDLGDVTDAYVTMKRDIADRVGFNAE